MVEEEEKTNFAEDIVTKDKTIEHVQSKMVSTCDNDKVIAIILVYPVY